MAQHTTDWVLTSQTNSKQTELANLVNRGNVTLYGDTDTGTVQFREGLYGNSNLSSLDIASIDSVTVYFTSVKKLPGGTSKFRCRKNSGDGTWLDTEISNSEKTQNKKLNGSFSKSAYYNADLSLVADIWSGNVTFSNVFLRITYTLNSYTVTFKNADGTVLETKTVESGTVPQYTGATPTKSATAEYTYTFAGWDKTISAATANVTYTATYTATKRKYTVTVNAGAGGTVTGVVDTQTLEYGTKISFTAVPDDGFRFVGWSDGNTDASRTITVTANTTYTAVFEKIETPPKFTSVKITPNPVIASEYCILSVGVE